MASTDYHRTINIRMRLHSDGNVTMTSPDLPGLFLGGKNLLALTNDLPEAIKCLYRLNYEMDVEVELASGFQRIDDAVELAGPLSYTYRPSDAPGCDAR